MSDPLASKVTALITRPGGAGPELVVFKHPIAGYQLPAGTVEENESFDAAARREAWEETGVLGLEMVRELGVLRLRNEERHILHLRSTIEMPDEWAVITPDGGGLEWTCFWASINEAHAIVHEHQRDWLDAVRPALERSAAHDPPVRPRPPLPAEFDGRDRFEQFHAPGLGGRRVVLTFSDDAEPAECTRVHGICVTGSGDVVLISGGIGWGLPGGGKEPGESTTAAFAREVQEEACARVVDSCFLGGLRFVELDEQGAVVQTDVHAQMWARVEIEEWRPQFETTARRLASPTEAVDVCPFSDVNRMLMNRAARVDPLLRREPS